MRYFVCRIGRTISNSSFKLRWWWSGTSTFRFRVRRAIPSRYPFPLLIRTLFAGAFSNELKCCKNCMKCKRRIWWWAFQTFLKCSKRIMPLSGNAISNLDTSCMAATSAISNSNLLRIASSSCSKYSLNRAIKLTSKCWLRTRHLIFWRGSWRVITNRKVCTW